jgi:hypothetical protein
VTRAGYRAWWGAFEAVLAEARARGELRPDVSPRAAADAVGALVVGVTTTALQAPGLCSPADATALLEVLLRGLTA